MLYILKKKTDINENINLSSCQLHKVEIMHKKVNKILFITRCKNGFHLHTVYILAFRILQNGADIRLLDVDGNFAFDHVTSGSYTQQLLDKHIKKNGWYSALSKFSKNSPWHCAVHV